MTYSIVARDPAAGHIGAAVQSAWYGSATCLLVEPDCGAAVSQAMGERDFADQVMDMVRGGSAPSEAVGAVMTGTATSAVSQVAMLDTRSTPAAFTGTDCIPEAGHCVGVDCSAQANMMATAGIPDAMVAAFEASHGDLTTRLLDALDAAQALGGDFRGMQSAGLTVCHTDMGVPIRNRMIVDVRIDDHREPLVELRRLVTVHTTYKTMNAPFARLLAGDIDGAVDAARRLYDAAPADPNVEMRLGIVLLAAGDQEGTAILSALEGKNPHWRTYARRSLQRHGIDPEPLFDDA